MKIVSRRGIAASIIVIAFGLAFLATADVSIRQGVNGECRAIRMPLAVKWTEFLARHYEYGRIAREVTRGCLTDQEKVLAILKWTHANVRKVPPDFPVVDDHILNIIIRGYGTSDQSADVFTTLCSYAGIDAFWTTKRNDAKTRKHPLSFVKLKGTWYVFDSYLGLYFMTRQGRLATVEDIAKDPALVAEQSSHAVIDGTNYTEFFRGIDRVEEPSSPRPRRQMPGPRMVYEIRKVLGLEKSDPNSSNDSMEK